MHVHRLKLLLLTKYDIQTFTKLKLNVYWQHNLLHVNRKNVGIQFWRLWNLRYVHVQKTTFICLIFSYNKTQNYTFLIIIHTSVSLFGMNKLILGTTIFLLTSMFSKGFLFFSFIYFSNIIARFKLTCRKLSISSWLWIKFIKHGEAQRCDKSNVCSIRIR